MFFCVCFMFHLVLHYQKSNVLMMPGFVITVMRKILIVGKINIEKNLINYRYETSSNWVEMCKFGSCENFKFLTQSMKVT